MPWAQVKEIKCHDGDVYLHTALGGSFIPRTAFPGLAEARAFTDAALAAKRGDYSRLTPVEWPPATPVAMQAPPPSQAWPPAPMVGNDPNQPAGPADNQPRWGRIEQDPRRARRKQ